MFAYILLGLGCNRNKKIDVSHRIELERKGDTIQLQKDYSYDFFVASENYLVWQEFHTKKIYYLNINSEEVFELDLQMGRGPSEYESVVSVRLVEDKIYLHDINQSKFIIFDLTKGEFLDDYLVKGSGILRMTNFGEEFYFTTFDKEGFIHFLSYEDGITKKLENSEIDESPVTNIYKYDGSFLANQDYIVLARYYEPSIILYDKQTQEMEDFEFDETENLTEFSLSEDNTSDATIKVGVRIFSSAFKKDSNTLLFVGKGKTKTKDFEQNEVYQYDIEKREFLVEKIVTDLSSIRRIATNKNYLFIYDNSEFTITILKL